MSHRADKIVIDARTHTHTQTDAGNDNTRKPKLASGKKKNVGQKRHAHGRFAPSSGGRFAPMVYFFPFEHEHKF